MRSYAFEHVDVFTEVPLEGNPLAVFSEPEGLDAATMQRIARELNLAETVFILPPVSPRAVATFRIFTPVRELTFAGHPTVGAVSVLEAEGKLPAGDFDVDEGVGPVPIRLERRAGGLPLIWLTTPEVEIGPPVDAAAAAASLGLTIGDLHEGLPPQHATAGSPFLFVALKSAEAVDRAEMNLAALPPEPWPGVVGTFLFALVDGGTSAYSRMFAPKAGVAEDPATGGATGPLVAYLLSNRALPDKDGLRFVNRQGVKMGRESRIFVRTQRAQSGEHRIEIGGTAVPVIRATLTLP